MEQSSDELFLPMCDYFQFLLTFTRIQSKHLIYLVHNYNQNLNDLSEPDLCMVLWIFSIIF